MFAKKNVEKCEKLRQKNWSHVVLTENVEKLCFLFKKSKQTGLFDQTIWMFCLKHEWLYISKTRKMIKLYVML